MSVQLINNFNILPNLSVKQDTLLLCRHDYTGQSQHIK